MPNPTVAAILEFNRPRDPTLLKIKYERMATSAFCFFRGTDHLFAADWRELQPRDPGPPVLGCGDLHLENFGAFITDDGQARYDINDFDEALVAPCSFDVVRCTTSIFLAAEEWQLSPVQAATLALAFVSNYRQAVTDAVQSGAPGEIVLGGREETVLDLLQNYLGSHALLLKAYTEKKKSGARRIVRDQKHFALEEEIYQQVATAVERYGAERGHAEMYRVLDVSGRIAGIGSLGIKRYTVLIEGQGSPDGNRLLDIKEVDASSASAAGSAPQPGFGDNDAERTVLAQRQLQGKPTRGLDTIPIGSQAFRLRDMIADENRSKLDNFKLDPERLSNAVELAGKITGWSHIRGSQLPGGSTAQDLARWAQEPAMDAVLASAIRFAERSKTQYAALMDFGLKKMRRVTEDPGALEKAGKS